MTGKRKPTHLKLLEGNPGKRPINKREPRPKKRKIKPPVFFNVNALAEWQRVAPELEHLGLLTDIDITALAAYCVSYSRWLAAEADIEENGPVIEGKHGRYKNPAVTVANSYLRQMRSFASEFGLTPASRPRLSVPKTSDPNDPWAL